MYILFPIHAFASSTLSPFASSFVPHCPSRFRYPSLYPSCCSIALLSGCSSILQRHSGHGSLKLNWKLNDGASEPRHDPRTCDNFSCRGIIFIVQLQPPSHDESTTTTATSRLVKDDQRWQGGTTQRTTQRDNVKGNATRRMTQTATTWTTRRRG